MRAMDAAPKLIAVVPTLNAAAVLPSMLSSLNGIEVVIADGGSTDETVSLGRAGEASVVEAPPGRGAQLAAGAEAPGARRGCFSSMPILSYPPAGAMRCAASW